jgi:hypothetical protein
VAAVSRKTNTTRQENLGVITKGYTQIVSFIIWYRTKTLCLDGVE